MKKKTNAHKIRNSPFTLLGVFTKSAYFGLPFFLHHTYHIFEEPTIEDIQKYDNTIVIYPKGNIRRIIKFSNNKKSLKRLYHEGYRKGKDALEKI